LPSDGLGLILATAALNRSAYTTVSKPVRSEAPGTVAGAALGPPRRWVQPIAVSCSISGRSVLTYSGCSATRLPSPATGFVPRPPVTGREIETLSAAGEPGPECARIRPRSRVRVAGNHLPVSQRRV